MRKRIAALGCALAMLAGAAMAEEAAPAPGQWAATVQAEALARGQAIRTETTFDWGGLPLLDEAQDGALDSLLDVLGVQTLRQQGKQGGLWMGDILLQGVSVLDLSMQAREGVYFEQSNLLGGRTVAFTPQEFQRFVARLSARAGGALPANLDIVLEALLRSLGAEPMDIDPQTMDAAQMAFAAWGEEALQTFERKYPTVMTPGLYGEVATVTEVTSDEILALAQAYSDLLAENDALWTQAARAQMPQAEEAQLSELARDIGETVRQLPQLLRGILPDGGIVPLEYREVYDADGGLVVRQVELMLRYGALYFAEWVPQEAGEPTPVYISGSDASNFAVQVRTAYQRGEPSTVGRETRQRNTALVEIGYHGADIVLDAMITSEQTIVTAAKKESIVTQTECLMQSDALFGEGVLVTLALETTDTASGTLEDTFARNTQTICRLKGLGFDARRVLTVKTRTRVVPAEALPEGDGEVVYPARMDDAALDVWLADNRVSMVQAWLTVLGRVPPDVASYLLTWIE